MRHPAVGDLADAGERDSEPPEFRLTRRQPFGVGGKAKSDKFWSASAPA